MIRLTTVGTGTASPTAHRVNSGQLIEASGTRLLMDCGSGVVHRLAALGADWLGITHLALTHFHPDHILDIPTLIFAWRYGTLPPRSEPLDLLGPPGTDALLDRMSDMLGDDLRAKGFEIRVHELAPGMTAQAGAFRLEAFKVPHTAESIAYSMEHRGRRIVYTGDTGPDAGLAAWAEGADVLLAECSLPSSMAIATHLTPEQCGAMAERAKPGLLALTHFYPPVEREDVRGIVAERFGGAVALATDGWTTEIEDE